MIPGMIPGMIVMAIASSAADAARAWNRLERRVEECTSGQVTRSALFTPYHHHTHAFFAATFAVERSLSAKGWNSIHPATDLSGNRGPRWLHYRWQDAKFVKRRRICRGRIRSWMFWHVAHLIRAGVVVVEEAIHALTRHRSARARQNHVFVVVGQLAGRAKCLEIFRSSQMMLN